MIPLISIIVPVYNVESFLCKCVDSIVNQTYGNLEIILVDDGSVDQSGPICNEYAAQDKRIVVIHQENKGLSEARNVALDIATGMFFLFVDSDDWIEKDACENVIKIAIEQHADLVSLGYNMVSSSGKTHTYVTNSPGIKEKSYVMRQLIWHRWIVSDAVWNKFYSRDLFDGVRFPCGKENEDVGTLYKLIHKAKTIYMSTDVLYNYLQREGSIIMNRNCYREHVNHMFFYEERLKFLRMYYPKLVDIQLSMMLKRILIDMYRLRGDSCYKAVKKDFSTFISENKNILVKCLSFICYYYCRALLLRGKRFVFGDRSKQSLLLNR